MLSSYPDTFPPCSAFQNEINVPTSSAGTCESAEELPESSDGTCKSAEELPESSGGTCKSAEELPERGSESSSISSDSESDSEQENYAHRTSHSTLCDDESVEVVHSAISSGDFGQVAELKTERKLTDHEKLTLLAAHFVPPRNYKFPTRNVGGRGRCFQHSWLEKHNGLVYS